MTISSINGIALSTLSAVNGVSLAGVSEINGQSIGSGPTGTPFILTQTLGTLRNDFTGCVGFTFTSSATPPTITALGRWVVSGNSGSHTVYLYETAASILASAVVNTSGATAGAYKYISITPVALASLTNYVVICSELNTGDQWYSDDTVPTSMTSGVGTINAAAGNTTVPPTAGNDFAGAVGVFTYGPVNFLF